MRFSDKLRFNSVSYFILSVLIRWLYNLIVLLFHGFTLTEKAILHLLLAVVSVALGWMAWQLFKKSNPSGSNLGCFYLFLLLVNIIGGFGAVFFALVQFFTAEGSTTETLWLL